jgi:hypothetical protein
MCDYSTVIGRTAVESGTFFDEAVGRAFQIAADDYELSPGFFHPYGTQGPHDGIYEDIRRFERSPVPRRYGRASNYYTGLMVKEQRMDPQEIARRVAAFKADMGAKGVGADVIDAALAGVAQSEKSADAQHAVFKSATIYYGPDNRPGIIQDGAWVALKAAPMPPEVEDKADLVVEDAPAEEMDMEGGQYIGDMTPAEFWAQLQQYLAPVLKVQELHKSLGDMMGEMKGMMGGYATKDDSRAAEIAALKSQQAQIDARLKALEGDQPAVTLPDEIAAALKSGGPQTPPNPDAPQIPNDPNRPFAAAAAALAPELYGAWNPATGWGSQQPAQSRGQPQEGLTNGWPTAGSN